MEVEGGRGRWKEEEARRGGLGVGGKNEGGGRESGGLENVTIFHSVFADPPPHPPFPFLLLLLLLLLLLITLLPVRSIQAKQL